MSYWDTSTLSKLYLAEPDSVDFVRKAANDSVMVTAKLTLYEMRRVAFRKENDGVIQPGTAEMVLTQLIRDIAAGHVRLIEIQPRVEDEFNAVMAACYRHVPPVPIRTLDALHIASARADGQSELVATDKRMREAAKLFGLSLFPA
jgi:uncharacterized protein